VAVAFGIAFGIAWLGCAGFFVAALSYFLRAAAKGDAREIASPLMRYNPLNVLLYSAALPADALLLRRKGLKALMRSGLFFASGWLIGGLAIVAGKFLVEK
jgi:hypothetical protein